MSLMDSLATLTRQLQIAREELKNIRQDVLKLKARCDMDILLIKSDSRTVENIENAAQTKKQSIKISRSLEMSKQTSFDMKPIGYIESCFKTKNGTPRQASLCPETKAYLKIDKSIFFNPDHSLEGLEDFSHIWVLFVFHQNGLGKNLKAKVHPPRLNGSSLGVFSTRSPHRPNPIGLSLIKLEKVEGDTLFLSGVDLIQGTPVLDIKPFILAYDSPIDYLYSDASKDSFQNGSSTPKATFTCSENKLLPNHDLRNSEVSMNDNIEQKLGNSNCCQVDGKDVTVCNQATDCPKLNIFQNCEEKTITVNHEDPLVKTAPWLLSLPETPLEVVFTHRSESDLCQFHSNSEHEGNCEFCLDFLTNNTEAKASIINVLKNDPRSVYRKTKCSDRLYYCSVDSMHVTCWFDNDIPLAEVLRVQSLKKS